MKLEEIRKLCDRTVPGPWEFQRENPNEGQKLHDLTWGGNPYSKALKIYPRVGGYYWEMAPCAEFICASRTLVPKLLAVAEAAKARLEVWTRENYIGLKSALEDLEREG